MIEQTYFLDMIPGESTPPVVHVSQFDVNSRTLTFNLMKGGVAYVPDAGMSVTLDGTKPDGTAFSYPMTVNGSSVSINVQTQMTVVSGHVKCEVSVSNVSGKIGSANFILAVEESAIDGGAISETDIPIFEDLKNQAQQAAASAEQYASDAETAASSVSSIVPASAGTTGQVLTKTTTGADWETPTGGQWGSITGTLSDQTDLASALAGKANTSTLATVETGTTSSKAYAVGEYLVYNGILYKVTTAITSSGQTLAPGSNITVVSVGDELTSLNKGLIVDELVTETKSWSQGVGGQNFGTYTKSGYTLIGVLPVSLARASTTLFSFQGTTAGLVYMTTNSNYAESNASLTVRLLWKKN